MSLFTSELRTRLAPWNWIKPSSKIQRWINCVIYVLCLSCFCVCSLLPCGHLLGKGRPLGSRLWCLIVFLSLSHVVSWVMCDTWMYRFLIVAPVLTFIIPNQMEEPISIIQRANHLNTTELKKISSWSTLFAYPFFLNLIFCSFIFRICLASLFNTMYSSTN